MSDSFIVKSSFLVGMVLCMRVGCYGALLHDTFCVYGQMAVVRVWAFLGFAAKVDDLQHNDRNNPSDCFDLQGHLRLTAHHRPLYPAAAVNLCGRCRARP